MRERNNSSCWVSAYFPVCRPRMACRKIFLLLNMTGLVCTLACLLHKICFFCCPDTCESCGQMTKLNIKKVVYMCKYVCSHFSLISFYASGKINASVKSNQAITCKIRNEIEGIGLRLISYLLLIRDSDKVMRMA